MKTETKSVTIEAMDDAGHGLAKLADLMAVDHDGDTYTLGAFGWKEGGEQWAPILPAHDRSATPLGKARVYESGNFAFAELHLNLDTTAGRDWHSHLKFDLKTGLPAQEWSYGFGVLDSASEQRGQDRVRNLKRLDVHEVSPVVRGAGAGTATLTMKSRQNFAGQIEAVIAEIEDIVGRAGDIGNLRSAEGREPLSKARLDQIVTLKGKLDDLIKSAAPAPNGDQTIAEQMAADFLTKAARKRLGIA